MTDCPCLYQRESEGSGPTAGVLALGRVPKLNLRVDRVVRVEVTHLQLGHLANRTFRTLHFLTSPVNLKFSVTFNAIEIVTQPPQSPENFSPAPKFNFHIRNKVAQVELWIPTHHFIVKYINIPQISHHSCFGRTVPSTPTSRFVPLHLIK